MKKIYKVQIDKLGNVDFYLVEKENEFISTLWQSIEGARKESEKPYAVVMQQGEVISYGNTLGFIKSKEETIDEPFQLEPERKKAIKILEAIAERMGADGMFDCTDNPNGDTKWYDLEDLVVDILTEKEV